MGWAWKRAVADRLAESTGRFSLYALVKTLFAPYKQTFTGQAGSGIGAMFRSAVDTFISRIVGFFVRSLIILLGLLHAVFVFVTGVVFVIAGPFLPLLLLISLAIGWWLAS
jgi:hypothetical protein